MADEARVHKVQDRIHQTVARMIGRKVKDPRLNLVTITDVRVTGDLQHATVYYTVFGDDDDHKKAARGFASAQGLFRSEVGRALGIRLTPTLEFVVDTVPQAAATIEMTLNQARARDAEIQRQSQGATFAGEADPYRHDDTDDADNAEYDADELPTHQ